MARQPLFAGLVIDEFDRPVDVAHVGDEPCYVIDDHGFRRHIPSEKVDRQVLEMMRHQISGNEDLLSAQAAKMMGTEDIFSKAIIQNQLQNLDQQFDQLLQFGIPEEGRAYMGMTGFKIVIDIHGEVIKVEQPAGADDRGEGDGE
ncbi:MAG: hypothetical protein ABIJ39_02735 [Chloroflexota bacterium]